MMVLDVFCDAPTACIRVPGPGVVPLSISIAEPGSLCSPFVTAIGVEVPFVSDLGSLGVAALSPASALSWVWGATSRKLGGKVNLLILRA